MSPQPGPPGYWMHETGGELAPAVRRYLNGQTLSVRDITLIRLYLQQWICAAVWDANPNLDNEGRADLSRLRKGAATLMDRRSIDAWLEVALEFGVDPL